MARDRIFVDSTKIVDTAFEMINKEGVAAFSTRKLAQQLGISPMTLYNYVRNKNEIIELVHIRGLNTLQKRLHEAAESHAVLRKNPLSIYRVVADELYDFALENRNIYAMIFNMRACEFTHIDEVRKLYGSAYHMIKEYIPEEKREAVHEEIFLFELVLNGLINQRLKNVRNFSRERYNYFIEQAMERLFTALN